MHIRAGFTLTYDCPARTPMLLVLDLHPIRRRDLLTEARLSFDRDVDERSHTDAFGNIRTRIVAPEGRTTISSDFEIQDGGLPDPIDANAIQRDVADLPDAVVTYLLGSRYCDTDLLSDLAWANFGQVAPGWPRVQAICDFVHDRIVFDYRNASPVRTAYGAWLERTGVCRDFAHLAIALCRCMNIPARYCTGYLGDIGIPPVDYPMDFSAWFEVWLGDRWHAFDARHNTPRIGRILMATGRDATDVALSTSFGPSHLARFEVFTDEIDARPARIVVGPAGAHRRRAGRRASSSGRQARIAVIAGGARCRGAAVVHSSRGGRRRGSGWRMGFGETGGFAVSGRRRTSSTDCRCA